MKKILLPVDGSKRSLRTVEAVKQLCDPAESDITIVKVVSAQLYINSMDEIKHNAEKAQPELDAVADLLRLPGQDPGPPGQRPRSGDRGVRQGGTDRHDHHDPLLPRAAAQARLGRDLHRAQRLVPRCDRDAGSG